jgi:hypothetical protein
MLVMAVVHQTSGASYVWLAPGLPIRPHGSTLYLPEPRRSSDPSTRFHSPLLIHKPGSMPTFVPFKGTQAVILIEKKMIPNIKPNLT